MGARVRKALFISTFVVIVLAMASPIVQAQAPDLAAIYRWTVDSTNRGNAYAAAAAFAEDGVFIVSGCPADSGCVGRAAIQSRIERTVAGGFRFTIIALQVSGNTVTAREEHRAASITAVGYERVVVKVSLTFRVDKIVRRVQETDLSDPQTAVFVNFQRLSGIVRRHFDALNRGDAAAALAVFTDDAVYRRGPLCPPENPCVGRERILRSIESTIRSGGPDDILRIRVSADTATVRLLDRGIPQRAVGIEGNIQIYTITFRGEKISSLSMDNELSDPQTAVFVFSGRLTTPTFGVSDVLALFGDEAVLDGLGLCTTAPCVGKAAIQREIERQRADNIRFTFISGTARLSADSFTRQIEIRSDSIRAVGVERIVAWHTTQVKGDRISAIHFSLDSNDPQTARFLAAPRVPARPPAAGVGAPAEGGFPVASVAITTLGGLLLAGAALWGRRGRPYQR